MSTLQQWIESALIELVGFAEPQIVRFAASVAKASRDPAHLAAQLSAVCELPLDDRVRAFADALFAKVPRAGAASSSSSSAASSSAAVSAGGANKAGGGGGAVSAYKAQQAADLAARRHNDRLRHAPHLLLLLLLRGCV